MLGHSLTVVVDTSCRLPCDLMGSAWCGYTAMAESPLTSGDTMFKPHGCWTMPPAADLQLSVTPKSLKSIGARCSQHADSAASPELIGLSCEAHPRGPQTIIDRDAHTRPQATSWATREAQYDAVCTWGIPDQAKLQRLSCLKMPVFVANGDSDPMILPHYSYLLAGLIPQARVKIYADTAHGFLFQHHADFAADVEAFLSDPH